MRSKLKRNKNGFVIKTNGIDIKYNNQMKYFEFVDERTLLSNQYSTTVRIVELWKSGSLHSIRHFLKNRTVEKKSPLIQKYIKLSIPGMILHREETW
jgi:hypothetical protein